MVFVKIIKFLVLFIVLSFSLSLVVKANYTSEEFQKSFYDIGYKEVHEALLESSEHFKQEIELPVQIPPIEFTHSFGRLNDLEGDVNDGFEIVYHHKDKPKNHYTIDVRPIKYDLELRKEYVDQTFKLKDGSKALYSTQFARGFNLLIFEKKGWQYILSINKAVSDKVKPEILVEIANSVGQ